MAHNLGKAELTMVNGVEAHGKTELTWLGEEGSGLGGWAVGRLGGLANRQKDAMLSLPGPHLLY